MGKGITHPGREEKEKPGRANLALIKGIIAGAPPRREDLPLSLSV